jgi:hypothetical protein
MTRTSLAIYAAGAAVMAVVCGVVLALGAPRPVSFLTALALGALTGEVVWRVREHDRRDRDGRP